MNSIEIRDLTKRVGNFALKDINLTLPEGVVMGFVGENGAGKTTTIKCILDILHQNKGTIKIFGESMSREEVHIKEEIGVVFDQLYIPDMLKITEIEKIWKGLYKNWDTDYFYRLLDKLKVPRNKTIKKLSRGMEMKLSIALALAHHPKLLILDEPTSGLDPIIRDDILTLFLDFMQDETHSILFSTHITSDLEKIADYITFIHDGRIQFSEEKEWLLEKYSIFKGSEEEFMELPENAVIGTRKYAYGMEALVLTEKVNPAFFLEKPKIEEIMMFMMKGEQS
ncbi:ABC transporter ATP-binding protein [Rummeliibacillus pycnus]|uniref:ABC transporter ATP-binding protein n=1 Tax=Rummeliibacillus pycnus TaxID=101070 RepID=UPI0037C768D5